MFEMSHGFTPFRADNDTQAALFEDILLGRKRYNVGFKLYI